MFKTYQEAFDTTIDKLVAQNKWAYDVVEDTCVYNGDGCACAVGINVPPKIRETIPEEISVVYDEVWDITSTYLKIEEEEKYNGQVVQFWEYMQILHDYTAQAIIRYRTNRCSFVEMKLDDIRNLFNIDTSKAALLWNIEA